MSNVGHFPGSKRAYTLVRYADICGIKHWFGGDPLSPKPGMARPNILFLMCDQLRQDHAEWAPNSLTGESGCLKMPWKPLSAVRKVHAGNGGVK